MLLPPPLLPVHPPPLRPPLPQPPLPLVLAATLPSPLLFKIRKSRTLTPLPPGPPLCFPCPQQTPLLYPPLVRSFHCFCRRTSPSSRHKCHHRRSRYRCHRCYRRRRRRSRSPFRRPSFCCRPHPRWAAVNVLARHCSFRLHWSRRPSYHHHRSPRLTYFGRNRTAAAEGLVAVGRNRTAAAEGPIAGGRNRTAAAEGPIAGGRNRTAAAEGPIASGRKRTAASVGVGSGKVSITVSRFWQPQLIIALQ